MYKKKFKAILVGLGNIGMMYDLKSKKKNNFFTHSKSIKFSKDFVLKAGVEISSSKRKLFEKKFKLPVFKNLSSALDKIDANLVIIATNENSHVKLLKRISGCKKIKYIILEKPGGRNFKELKYMFRISEKNNIRLFLNYFRMYDEYYSKEIKNLFSKKNIDVVANYKRGIRNNCSHIINFLLMLNIPRSQKDIKFSFFKKHSEERKKIVNVSWNKSKAIFINPDIKKFSFVKIQVFSNLNYILSNNDFSEFDLYEKKKSVMLSGNSEFKFFKTLKNKNKDKYQKFFYDRFKENVKNYKYYKKISLFTSYIIDRMSLIN